MAPIIERKELLDNMEKLRKWLCGYSGDKCDCKFGADPEESSEQSGCAELRTARYLIERLSDREYARIYSRKLPAEPDPNAVAAADRAATKRSQT